MEYDQVNEEPLEYRKSTGHYIAKIVGDKNYKVLLDKFGNTNNILNANEDDYTYAGLPKSKAELLAAAKNLRMEEQVERVRIKCSMDIYRQVYTMADYNTEHFVVICLNRANEILKTVTISKGGLSGTVVDTKVLFSEVLNVRRVNAIVLVHNHPSGNSAPSESDLELTKKIVEGGKLLDIKVLDHIIVAGPNKYLSFADESYL